MRSDADEHAPALQDLPVCHARRYRRPDQTGSAPPGLCQMGPDALEDHPIGVSECRGKPEDAQLRGESFWAQAGKALASKVLAVTVGLRTRLGELTDGYLDVAVAQCCLHNWTASGTLPDATPVRSASFSVTANPPWQRRDRNVESPVNQRKPFRINGLWIEILLMRMPVA